MSGLITVFPNSKGATKSSFEGTQILPFNIVVISFHDIETYMFLTNFAYFLNKLWKIALDRKCKFKETVKYWK